jgi:hypothetical protein
MTRIMKLLPGDAGRPFTDIATDLVYDTLEADAGEVLETLIFKEKQVMTRDGSWFMARIIPYRTIANVIDGTVITFIDITRQMAADNEKEKLFVELQQAMENVKKLGGMLPICSSCKKIRDDQGYWKQIESYISEHSEAEFSHSICPECAKKLYPEVVKDTE